jgi:hypothetical protein
VLGYVEIPDEAPLRAMSRQLLVERRRVRVEEADPGEAGALEEGLDQPEEAVTAVPQVLAVADDIKPIAAPTLPILRRGEKLLDDLSVGLVGRIGRESLRLLVARA